MQRLRPGFRAFAGITSAVGQAASGCGIALSWPAATSVCGGSITYNVYRSGNPVFTPGNSNFTLLASHVTAQRFEKLTYDQVIERKLAVMDTAAIALCRDHKIPLRIFDMEREGALMRIIRGEQIGTLVS